MKVAIVKYNAGNVYSMRLALQRINIQPVITDNKDVIQEADKVIFPGVGEASSAMAHLRKIELDAVLPNLKQPFLGVCLGLQLLCQSSSENNTQCLGVFDETVEKFPSQSKVPHMGWNTINFTHNHLFSGIEKGAFFYFVHSYFAATGKNTIAQTNYILPFSAALQKNNFYAVQFHPEKSGPVGEQILRNFLAL